MDNICIDMDAMLLYNYNDITHVIQNACKLSTLQNKPNIYVTHGICKIIPKQFKEVEQRRNDTHNVIQVCENVLLG